tara:strand:+ start:94 stop:963 length:870 start_codon:yes stop_codon:yes gene_type:complete
LNYLYIYLGKVPEYVKNSINAVLSVDKDAEVYFCSEYNPGFRNVNFINVKDLQSELTMATADLNIYNETNYDSSQNSLWINSLLRIFYINDFLDFTNLNQLVHFDSDVVIYKPFNEISEVFTNNQLNITKLDNERLIFGYSFIPRHEVILNICKKIFDFLEINNSKNSNFKINPLNEMQILGNIMQEDSTLFNTLPDLPYFGSQNIFDPASYGQYLGGTHQEPKKWYKKKRPILDHTVGQEIGAKRIEVNFENSIPSVSYNQEKYDLVNLHIHSKNLSKFNPKEYKDYV